MTRCTTGSLSVDLAGPWLRTVTGRALLERRRYASPHRVSVAGL